jgi:hypothetical protein
LRNIVIGRLYKNMGFATLAYMYSSLVMYPWSETCSWMRYFIEVCLMVMCLFLICNFYKA